MTTHPFDPARIVRTLQKHKVRFLIIGGFAGRLWGSPSLTNDLDLCYARDRDNFSRLATALKELKARLRGVKEAVPFLLDARTLAAGDHFTFETLGGNLDILGFPAGSRGFDELSRTAEGMEISKGLHVSVAALEDLIRMKRAAGRPKDLVEVEILAALQDEIEGGQES